MHHGSVCHLQVLHVGLLNGISLLQECMRTVVTCRRYDFLALSSVLEERAQKSDFLGTPALLNPL